MTRRAVRIANRTTLFIARLALVLCSCAAVAQEGVPFDVYGRPLADQLGPIRYEEEGGGWIAIHADGTVEPAPPGASVGPPAPSADPQLTGFHFDPYVVYPTGSQPQAVAIGDVTGDGLPDVVMATGDYFDPANDYMLFLFRQARDGTLEAPVKYSYGAHADFPAIALADLKEDGILDVIVGHATGIAVLLADGSGGLRDPVVTTDADAFDIVVMDVDRDGHMDVISLGSTRGATIFSGDGHGGFRQRDPLATRASGLNDLKTADLTGDGVPDLAVMTGNNGAFLSVHRHNGVDGFAPGFDSYNMRDFLLRGVGLGDISGDGLNDAVLSRPHNGPTWLWIMLQDSSTHLLTGPTTISSFEIPEAVEVADMDGDGRDDVVVTHPTWINLGFYRGAPGGGLNAETLYPMPYCPIGLGASLAVGDFSSDGCPDIAIACAGRGLVVFRGSGCVPRCQAGHCDDNNPCTDDSCNPAVGCVHTNNTAPCDDEDACTTNDTCSRGACRPGVPVNCDDDDCCTLDSCDPSSGCSHTPNPDAPVFTVQPSVGDAILWPPNHGYVDFTVADTGASAQSACGIVSVSFVSCRSSQRENAVATGDGNTLRDCIYEPNALHLRAERDGACSPVGRVYETTLMAVDTCGRFVLSSPMDVPVWHDRDHGPSQGTSTSSAGGTLDVRQGTNGTYGIDCGSGSPRANGSLHDDSDADPEREISQLAALDVDTLRVGKSTSGGVVLEWEPPSQAGQVTRYHVWKLDARTHAWKLSAELTPQTASWTDPEDGASWMYEVSAVIK